MLATAAGLVKRYDDDVEGAEILGDILGDILGARSRGGRGGLALNRGRGQPSWRQGQVAPGVQLPGEGLVPLPLSPQQGNGVFTAAITQITWTGQVQQPFTGERLIASVLRTGTTATGLFVNVQIFAGTKAQQADILPVNLEHIATGSFFGIRNSMIQVQPGVLLRILGTISGALTSPDTVAVGEITLFGKTIH
jgi:hypothetical protein